MRKKNIKVHTTIIKDPQLEPYFITKDKNCYTVNYLKILENGKDYIKHIGHYSNFGSCLLKICQELTNLHPQYDSVHSYLKVFKEYELKMMKLMNLNI